jgi:HD superfamily phosphohydrolase
LIVTKQADLRDLLGGVKRANRISDLFTRSQTADPQLSKLIHSSLDMDRLDYLLRDSSAAGVPYGHIDINYLLNSLQVDQSGLLGVSPKAIPAAEQFLFARYFMYRTVYYHKTIHGLEEVCRHLLRRLRDFGKSRLPKDGGAVETLVAGKELGGFTDAFVDQLVQESVSHEDEVISALARTISGRRPPKLLKEVVCFAKNQETSPSAVAFQKTCEHRLEKLAKDSKVPLGDFIYAETKPLRIEERGHEVPADEARELPDENTDELIRVVEDGKAKPLVDSEASLVKFSAQHVFKVVRLFVVYHGSDQASVVQSLREKVKDWDK